MQRIALWKNLSNWANSVNTLPKQSGKIVRKIFSKMIDCRSFSSTNHRPFFSSEYKTGYHVSYCICNPSKATPNPNSYFHQIYIIEWIVRHLFSLCGLHKNVLSSKHFSHLENMRYLKIFRLHNFCDSEVVGISLKRIEAMALSLVLPLS